MSRLGWRFQRYRKLKIIFDLHIFLLFPLNLSSLNARCSTFFGWVFALIVGCCCNDSVISKLLELGVSILICGVSCSSRSLLFGRLVLKKSTWKLFSSGRVGAERLPLASLELYILCLTFLPEFEGKTRNQKANWVPILHFFQDLFLSLYQQITSDRCVKNNFSELQKSEAVPEICTYVVYSACSICIYAYIYSLQLRSNYTGEHPCSSFISMKLHSNFLEITHTFMCVFSSKAPVYLQSVFWLWNTASQE